ncbi:MAG: hypothetical protein FWF08_04210 [Oscillospiraceae bacterium]|nr:hypothetical protein [Oscillospiraceae bacterium]
MRKQIIFASISLLFLLILLISCANKPDSAGFGETTVHTEQQTAGQADETTAMPETTAKNYPPPNPPETVDTDYVFGEDYAKTPTRFFAVYNKYVDDDHHRPLLLYAQLKNLSSQKEIELPEKHKGINIEYATICGITDEYLYIGCSGGEHDYVTYRISLRSFSIEDIDVGKYIIAPRYHAATDSLLFVCTDGDYTTDGYKTLRFEAMSMTDGKREVIMDDGIQNWGVGNHWRTTVDGMTVYEGTNDGGYYKGDKLIVIDKDNKAALVDYKKVDFANGWQKKKMPQNKAEKDLVERDEEENLVWSYATCGDYVYYVENVGYTENGISINDFYKIKTDGSNEKLLKADTNISNLIATDDNLYCLTRTFTNEQESGWNEYKIEFHSLNKSGITGNIIAKDMNYLEYDDNGYRLRALGGMIMMNEYIVYGGNDGYFAFLYDPATDKVFSFEGWK